MAEVTVSSIRLSIIVGATFSTAITWRDEAGTLVPLPTGTTAEAKVRPRLYSDEVLFRFTTSPSGTTDGLIAFTDPGITTLSMTATKTALLEAMVITDAVFDIRYLFTGGLVVLKLTEGTGRVDVRLPTTRT
jgi:hypothetical protein